METQIKDSLIALMAGIKAADGTVVAHEMGVLDEIIGKQADLLHPQLAHFLERRSYAKALQFLGGAEDIPTGSCGGRPAKG